MCKLATIQFLAYVSHEVFAIWALYAIYRFAWDRRRSAISLSLVGVFTAAISGGLTGRIVAWLGERRTLYIGQFFGALGMVIAGLAGTGAALYGFHSGDFDVEYFLSRRAGNDDASVGEQEQGELQGAIRSLRSIAFVIGPFLFSGIFAWFINPKHSFHLPGAPYYLAAAFLFTAMLLATGVQQPDFSAAKSALPDRVPDIVPPEGVTSGNVAPLADALSPDDV